MEGSVPVVSEQGSEPCCSSHALAKATVEILDKLGYDSNQEAIITTLTNQVESPANTDTFNGVKIELEVTKKIDQEDCTLAVEIMVEKDVGQLPINKEDTEAMVIRWMYYEMREGKYTPHDIYAKEYDEATEKYNCVNSWGGGCEGYPQVHKSQVEAVYKISLKVLT